MTGFGASVFTIGDDRVVDFYVDCVLYVNAISVGALRMGFYVEEINENVLAIIKPEMELRAVLDF